ncbi:hypothetical protein RhiirC2_777513 [Rhizophagus irregularis]|uniref:Uncharacterized protein n=1 Tax=Rhizophagus irregularis TaxID=588596 RepID=A0A2N1NE87_9GLOM|nr:hypothetical protein RhiirC2_777513 [Rhizophagus irregularis]
MSNSKQRPYEQENYPASPEIIYYGDQKFNYTVIQEGVYPPVAQLKFTEAPNYFPVPDNYIIKTTWGRSNNCQTIQCSIYYIEGNLHYLICFGNNFQHQVVSVQSTFDASVELHNIITSNKKTAVSGVHLYGLQLKCIDRNRKSKLWALKLHDESSKTTQIRHAKGLAKCAQINFENSIQNYYNPKDHIVLKTLEFTVQNKDYYTTFGEKNPNKQKQKLQSVVHIQDVENVPHDAYHYFAAMESKLPQKYAISQTRQKIDAHIEQLIPINFVDLTPTITPDFSEEPDITDPIIVEQVNSAIGKGAYRSIKKILKYIVPAYIQNEKLDPASPIIHLRISGDGHNVEQKVKHVMITVALLDDSAKLFEPNYHYTVVLFPGTENYSTLKIAADTLIRELQELSSIGMVIDNICEIAKNQHGDRQTEWIISKKMSILNENPKAYLDHHSPPLFNMIPLDHYVPDKLHIMLRITDRLWELVLQEIKNEGLFNDIT